MGLEILGFAIREKQDNLPRAEKVFEVRSRVAHIANVLRVPGIHLIQTRTTTAKVHPTQIKRLCRRKRVIAAVADGVLADAGLDLRGVVRVALIEHDAVLLNVMCSGVGEFALGDMAPADALGEIEPSALRDIDVRTCVDAAV